MRNHGPAGLDPLPADSVYVSLHYIVAACSSPRQDDRFKIGGIHMDGVFLKGVCYLFSLNKDELLSFLKLFSQLFKSLQTHEKGTVL